MDQDLRPLSAQEMIDSTRNLMASYPGIKYAVTVQQEEGGGNRQALLSVRGPDLDILTEIVYDVEDMFRRAPGAVDVTNSLQEGKPELQVSID